MTMEAAKEEKEAKASYVSSLKDQIKLLEMECSLLKTEKMGENKKKGIDLEDLKSPEDFDIDLAVELALPSSPPAHSLQNPYSRNVLSPSHSIRSNRSHLRRSSPNSEANFHHSFHSSRGRSSNPKSRRGRQKNRISTTSKNGSNPKMPVSAIAKRKFKNGDYVDASIIDLKKKHQLLQMEHESELEKRDEKIELLKQKLARMAIDLADSRKEKQKYQAEAEVLIQNHDKNLEHKLETLALAEEENITMKAQMEETEKGLNRCQDHLRNEVLRHQLEETSLKDERDELARALEVANALNQELEEEFTKQKVDYAEMKQKSEGFSLRETELREKLEASKVTCDSLRGDLAFIKQRQTLNGERITSLETENERLVRMNADLEGKVEDLSRKLVSAHGLEDTLTKNFRLATEAKSKAEMNANLHQQRCDEALQTLRAEQKTLSDNMETLAQLRAEKEFLKEKLSLSNKRLEGDKVRREELEKQVSVLKAQNDLRTAQISTLESSCLQLKAKVTNVEQENMFLQMRGEELEEKAELAKDLEQWDVQNLQQVMQSNLELATKFDQFLKKHSKQ